MGKSGKGDSNFIDDRAADAIQSTGQRVLTQEEIDSLVNSISDGGAQEAATSASPSAGARAGGEAAASKPTPSAEADPSQSSTSEKPFSEDEIDNLLSDIKKKKSKGKPT